MEKDNEKISFQLSDEELMIQLHDGDLASAAILYERWKRGLFNYFYRLSGDESGSEDLTQMVFERLIKYRTTYKEGMLFKAWVFQIARNVHHTAKKKRSNKLVTLNELNAYEGSETPLEYLIERQEEKEALWQAMDQLTPEQREILLFTKFQKIPYKEVGEMLNCTEGAVKVKVHRAIASLRLLYFKMGK